MNNRIRILTEINKMNIRIKIREDFYRILPVYIISLCTFIPGIFLSAGEFLLLEFDYLLLISAVVLLFLGAYGLASALFDTFGEERIELDNMCQIMEYEKLLFGIGIHKKYKYKEIKCFFAETNPMTKGTSIPERCAFKYRNKTIRFGALKEIHEGENLVLQMNEFIDISLF